MRRLTATQREVLETLVRLYDKEKRSIKSKEIATILNKDEGTVRNIIAWLKGMGLIESLTGPSGGYIPTLKAYDVIKGSSAQGEEYGYGVLTAFENGSKYRFIARSLEIMGLLTGGPVRAVVKILGDLNKVKEGSRVRLESLLWRKLVLEGVVKRINMSAGEILVEIDKLVAIPDEYVEKVATKSLIYIKRNESLKEAAEKLMKNKIRGAPVVDERNDVVGFITMTDIAGALAKYGNPEERVELYMNPKVFTISENDTIFEAMKLMDLYRVGRLVVTNDRGTPCGIITRTDILKYIAGLHK